MLVGFKWTAQILTVDELLNKLSLQIGKVETDGTTLHSLGTSSLKVFLLTNISHVGNNLIALLNKPQKNARSVCKNKYM